MPRVKLERLVDSKTSTTRNQSSLTKAAKEEAIVADSVAAIVPSSNHPVTQPERVLKKLAGTPFMVDVDTGLIYLENKLLKAIKNC